MTQLIGPSKVLEVIEQAKTTQKSSFMLDLRANYDRKIKGGY